MIISPDNFIYENGKYNWSSEKAASAWKKSFAALRVALIDGSYSAVVLMSGIPGAGKTTWLSKNEDKNKIYFDATLTDKAARAKVIKEIRSVNSSISIESVMISTPYAKCLERNNQRTLDRQVPLQTMRAMYSKLSYPEKQEGFSSCLVVKEDKKEKFTSTHFSIEEWSELKSHPDIVIKPSGKDGICSVSFSRDVFYRAAWDDITTTTRGLFVEPSTRKIVMRSYDKFFNINEVKDTQYHMLEKNMRFPVKVYEKYNGYLGMLSFYNNDFVFATKTSMDSNYVDWFKNIFYISTTSKSRQEIKNFFSFDKNINNTMLFEVIDPLNDSHIIKYSEPKLVLLDIVPNVTTFAKFDYSTMDCLFSKIFELKKCYLTINSKEEFKSFYDSLSKRDSVHPDIEGFVVEDSSDVPIMFKIKLDNYLFWKKMRSLKDRMKTIQGTKKPLDRDISSRKAKLFYDWLNSKPKDYLDKDIISLKDLFNQDQEIEK